MLSLLAVFLIFGMMGCKSTTQAKELPQEFEDAQSVQAYLQKCHLAENLIHTWASS